MSVLQVIEQREVLGKQLTMYGDFENPLFLAKEVAEWIEHSNPRVMLQAIDEDEKEVNIVYTLGGNQEMWFLTEDGLYEVLMQSRKPIAKQFKKAVKEILKSIRKQEYYTVDNNKNAETKAKLLRAEAMVLNAKNRAFHTIMKSVDNKQLSPIAVQVFGLKGLESVFGIEVGNLLPKTEKTYSATDVGNILGISAVMVGKMANANGLKTADYGVFIMDKSKYSAKEVESFRYNEKGLEALKELAVINL